MPINTDVATKQWYRFQFARDNGHSDFIAKADLCERFFQGDQWNAQDLQALREQLRPALTINKIISTIGNVMGEQIYNRNEIGFLPMSGAPQSTADTLTKVFKQISANNQLDWRRSDMFADGIITSRGFLDVRMDFSDNVQGEVRITHWNPKNVIVDPDAEEYDPDSWNEVMTTKWMTADDIAILYSRKDAELLRNREQSYFPYGYDSIEATRDRFGFTFTPGYGSGSAWEMSSVLRNLRIIERQYRTLDRQKHFIDPKTGDTRQVPEGWDSNRINLVVEKLGWDVIPKLTKRIKWTVICDNIVLHDDWSPYEHFTIVPYFPMFRRGKTIGLVENLIGSQELLNKVSSQELHVVNSSANSGWLVKSGSLVNMSLEQLEAKGAQSGLVLELTDLEGAKKITPNATPQGLDRISYKAEEHIKTISGVSDSQQGMDREDVAAKAIQAKRQAASTNNVKPLDALNRTDFILARNVLSLVQRYYTDERLLTIEQAHSGANEAENVAINAVQANGEILNDLTIGEYQVMVSSVPQRETLEDSQFEQAVTLKRDLGLPIPDEFIIENSRLLNKRDLIQKMKEASESPEAKAAAQLQQAQAQAEVDKTNAETAQKQADAQLKGAKTGTEQVKAQKDAATPIETTEGQGEAEMVKVQAEMSLEERRFELESEIKRAELELKRMESAQKMKLAEKTQVDQAMSARIAAAQPKTQPQGEKS